MNKLPALRLACCNHEINLLLFNRGQLQLDRVTPGARTTTLRTRARAPLINTFETNALGLRLLRPGGRYRSSPHRLTGDLLDQPTSINLVGGWLWLGFADFQAFDKGRNYGWVVAINPDDLGNSCKGSFQNTCLNPSVTMTGSLAARRDRGLSASEGPALPVGASTCSPVEQPISRFGRALPCALAIVAGWVYSLVNYSIGPWVASIILKLGAARIRRIDRVMAR